MTSSPPLVTRQDAQTTSPNAPVLTARRATSAMDLLSVASDAASSPGLASSPGVLSYRSRPSPVESPLFTKSDVDVVTTAEMLEYRKKREKRIEESIPKWREIIANWERKRDSEHTRKLWWSGIPPCFRGKVWVKCCRNDLNITQELFEIYNKQAALSKAAQQILCSPSPSSSTDIPGGEKKKAPSASSDDVELTKEQMLLASVDEAIGREVGKVGRTLVPVNLHRSFRSLQIFHEGGPLQQPMRDVLEAYVCYRPDLGYVQCMSYLVAMLLLNTDTFDSFSILANMLNSPLQVAFYGRNVKQIDCYVLTVERLLAEYAPKLSAHFKDIGLLSSMYLADWVMTLFTKAVPLEIASHIWDVFFLEGESFIFRTVIGILKHCSPSLLKMNLEESVEFLSCIPEEHLVDEALFHTISAIPLSDRKFVSAVSVSTHEMQT